MITDTEREKIKEVLGSHYTSLVQDELHKKQVRNQNGHPHSDNMVRQVMNGNRSHADIETAIYNAVKTANKLQKKELKKRRLILEQTKTGAATPA